MSVQPEDIEPGGVRGVTDCPDCWQAEATWQQRLARVFAPRPSPAMMLVQSYATTMQIAMGGSPVTWYDRHRKRWEETGDERELERMTRHVRPA